MDDIAKKNQKYSEISKIITLTTIIMGIILIILNLFYLKGELFVIKQILQVGLYLGLGYMGVNAIGINLKRDIAFTIIAITISAITIYLFKKAEYTVFPIFVIIAFLFFMVLCLGVMVKRSVIDRKIWSSIGYSLIIIIILAEIYYGSGTGEFLVPY